MLKLLFSTALTLASCTGLTEVSAGNELQEDDPGWNCLTMGNRQCGPNDGVHIETDPSGHISIYNGNDLIGWGDLEGSVQD